MPLAITEDHRALAEVAAAMVAGRAGTVGARRILLDREKSGAWWSTDGLWKEMVSTGWLGLHIDERFGGQGYGLPELTIVLEQLGRAAVGGPFLPTVAVSAVISEVGTDEQRERWLPRLVSGDVVAGIGTNSDVAVRDSTVSAAAVPALAEAAADLFLLPSGDDLVLVQAGDGVSIRTIDSVDQLLAPVIVASLDSVHVAEVFPGAAGVAVRILRLLAAAEAVGGLGACTEMATAYAAGREQFGRPIGSFQAIKHHCANMLVDTELATAATWDAARAVGAEAELAATMAAGHALTAYQRVSLQNVQVHGGIGYTWEHDAHLYIRRATVLQAFAGDQDALRDKVIALQLNGVRRRQSVDLPEGAEQYRQAALDFRSELEASNAVERQRLWARSGYLQPHWPAPYGRAADSVEQLIIEDALDGLDKPSLGLGEWVVPTLLQHGSKEQVDRLIWPSLEGELRWCQLFSEPGAGSDAAAVATKATRVADGWVVSGQKVWTSDAVNCQRGLATVRTDPKARKHKGITAMIIDLSDPAVRIRPLTEITGETLFNEVFFDDVFVPDRDVVGAVNDGWSVAMAAFGNERVSIGGGSVTMTAEALIDLLERHRPGDSGVAREVGALLIESYTLATLNLRQAARAVFDAGAGIEGNIAKLFGAEHAQRVAELALRIADRAILVGEEPEVVHDYLFSRCLTIAGGTSEIVRNLIAERILGLPRDPAPK
ncbi:acyl-CoA dehydrogenase [Mycobacterium intracellulare]|uniref:Acyl-CoA dehydrogenase n=1 Tax=Mycobacterium intracellulare (strain ATCC 13950 / DSM 43223 / JCM 6384 / NCTC 13025 / 3600) TaxID=487521 RepID=H8IJY1_MYCIA|nr:acyl-CoA dehydrogenase [Mycobacterium intracellulare]AFC42708.1 acyl-CoA dehydrogenase [Mycobacterium intracellulare ATCC 13950]AFC47806.1 acyl-CoA dehydrogenase [Mycobacterium intracellulare MOTT-02]ASW94577.1 acyl-CoA dehydrogenase [Mycobacterium intracellulare]ETZ37978.1 acyl-CoA dehydrogenase, C-terminal domain protein [Mycobacterium intracellulare MIN_061107_1834]MCA2231267.1 acyl-CoA dehydrogenase [Mycobacterium intracellulare]